MTAQEFKEEMFPHRQKLYGMAFVMLRNEQDAEDALQEVFAKLWNMRDSLSKIANSEAFCVQLIKNIALDMLRHRKVRSNTVEVEEVQLASSNSEIEEQLDYKSSLNTIQKWLAMLPDKQRAVFLYRHEKELSIRTIANELELTESNVKVILSRLRNELKEVLISHE